MFDGETYVMGTGIQALDYTSAMSAINGAIAANSAGGLAHIAYLNPAAHNNGSNYVFADGHAKWETLDTTLDPNDFQWGKRAWSCPGTPAVMRADGGGPVG